MIFRVRRNAAPLKRAHVPLSGLRRLAIRVLMNPAPSKQYFDRHASAGSQTLRVHKNAASPLFGYVM